MISSANANVKSGAAIVFFPDVSSRDLRSSFSDVHCLQDLYERECEMALQDKVQSETADMKNKLEAYIYSLRNKLYDRLSDYVTETEKSDISQKLEAAEVPLPYTLNHTT